MSYKTMTDGEVVTSFRQAKDKREQIGILADLNLCRKDEILNILAAAGEDVSEYISGIKKRKIPTKYRKWTADEVMILEEGCKNGGSCEDIAHALERTVESVYAKAVDMGFVSAAGGEVTESAADDDHVLGGMLDMLCRMVAAMKKEPRRVHMDIPGDDFSKLVMDFSECQISVIM